MSCNISKGVFNVKCFASTGNFVWDSVILFVTTSFLIYIYKFAFSKLFWLHSFSEVVVSKFSPSVIAFVTPWVFNLNFISSIITFYFFVALSSLFANSLFQLSVFVKCHVGLSLGHKEATQLQALLSVCELTTVQWPITDRLEKKWPDWSLIRICIYYLFSDLWTEELAAKFVLYAVTYS